jgi:hypothetical protein
LVFLPKAEQRILRLRAKQGKPTFSTTDLKLAGTLALHPLRGHRCRHGNQQREPTRMKWLQLTQANMGVKVYVNMNLIVLIAPNKTGGSSLVSSVQEKESARMIMVTESPDTIFKMMNS